MKKDDEMEAILTATPGADTEKLRGWLGKHGIETMDMRAGLLLTGRASKFAALFGGDADELSRSDRGSISFSIPKEFAEEIRSIICRPNPKLHG